MAVTFAVSPESGCLLSKWQCDFVRFDVAVTITRRGTSSMRMSSLGSCLTVLSQTLLKQASYKLRNFLIDASDDFAVDGTSGSEMVHFTGSAECLQPARVPADAEVFVDRVLNKTSATAGSESVSDEIGALLLVNSDCHAVLLSHLGSRISANAKKWLRTEQMKLLEFLQRDPRFSVSGAASRETVCFAGSSVLKIDSRRRPSFASTTMDSPRESVCSRVSSSESTVSSTDYAFRVSCILRSLDLSTVAQMLTANQPAYYEE